MAILSKACKPDSFKLHNSLKLSFMNIWGHCWNFIDCESFLESNSPDILALCETNLDDSIDSGNFSVRDYLPLIWKGSSTHMQGLSLWEGRTAFSTGLISRELCRFLLTFSTSFTSLSFFFLYLSSSLSLSIIFDSISSNIDEFLLVKPSVNVFVLRDILFIMKTGLSMLVELMDLVNSVIIFLFLSQTTLLRWLTFLHECQIVILIVLLF